MTVFKVIGSVLAMVLSGCPADASKKMRQRWVTGCGVPWVATQRSSSRWSLVRGGGLGGEDGRRRHVYQLAGGTEDRAT